MKMESDVIAKVSELEKERDTLNAAYPSHPSNKAIAEIMVVEAKIKALNWVTNMSQEI